MSSSEAAVVIQAPDQSRDYKTMVEVTSTIFRPHDPTSWIERCDGGYIAGSCYDWDASRIARIDGELVAHVGVWRLNLRIGSSTLLCGGIGAVGTTPVCRGRGIASGLMKAVFESMADGGYVISSMYGRSNFYGRYGYKPVFSRSYAMAEGFTGERLNEGIAALLNTKLTRRNGDMEQLLKGQGDIGRIYESGRKYLSFTADRPAFTLNCNKQVKLAELVDNTGQIRAYISYSLDDEHITVCELGGFETPAERRELLGQIYKLAIDNDRAKAQINIPRTHPMMTLLKRYDCGYNEYFHADGNAMVAVINLAAVLESLKPELERRISASALSGGDFAINLGAMGKSASVRISRGHISISDQRIAGAASVEGDDLPRMLLGSEPVEQVLEAGQFDYDQTILPWLNVLFPATDPRLPDAEYH